MKLKKVIALLLSLLIMFSASPTHTVIAEVSTGYAVGDECEHNWVDGYCDACESYCDHEIYENYICIACGMPCYHYFYDGVCDICGYICLHDNMHNGECPDCYYYCQHEFDENYTCTLCGTPCYHEYSFYNSVCQDCGYVCFHDMYNGSCLICDYYCYHEFDENYICTICLAPCSHEYSFYAGVCQDCGFECLEHDWSKLDGVCAVCKTYCDHDSLGDDPCDICGMRCSHYYVDGYCEDCGHKQCIHVWNNSVCDICEKVCTHHYREGVCQDCGITCESHTYDGGSVFCTNCYFQCVHEFEGGECVYCGIDHEASIRWQGDVAYEFAGGSGTKTDPYQISTAEQLAYFAQSVRNGNDFTYGYDVPIPYYIILTSDIDLNNIDFDSIGIVSNQGESRYFAGHFDGCGYTIKNFYTTSQGLFGGSGCWLDYTTSDCGRILNLNVIGEVNAIGYERDVGGLVGRVQGGYIENCSFTGKVTVTKTTYQFYGGLVGEMEQGEINNCIVNAVVAVSGGQARGVGGILGGAEYNPPILNNCANKGNVSSTNAMYIGAIAGSYNKIINCYNLGNAEFAGLYRGYEETGIYNSFDASDIQNGIVYMSGESDETEILSAPELLVKLNAWVEANGSSWTSATGDGYYAWKMGADTPVFENETVETTTTLTLEVFTATTDGNTAFDGQVNMEGTANEFEAGDVITLTAVYNGEDYRFIGWYADGDMTKVIANTKVYSITVTDEMVAKGTLSLIALFEKVEKVSVSVNISGSASTVKINGSEQTSGYTYSFLPGTAITFELTDAEGFAYWEVNGKVVSRDPVYTFTVVNGITVNAIYNTKLENKKIVIFESAYGQIIQRMQMTYEELEESIFPAVPVKAGRDDGAWEMTLDEIKAEFKKDEVEVITIRPKYSEITATATVTVIGGTIKGTEALATGEYTLNSIITLVANAAEEGMMFAYWADENGNVVGYNESYSFYLAGNAVVTAVFVEDTQAVEKVGTAEIIEVIKDTENGKISAIAMLTVHEGCTIDYAGIVASTNAEHANNLTAANAPIVRGEASDLNALRFTWTAGNKAQKTIWIRAYLVYTDEAGNSRTVYGDIIEINYENN